VTVPGGRRPGFGFGALALLLTSLVSGCRDAVERRAGEIADLRAQAADGIVAIEAYCTARDSALAAAQRGDPGAELWLEETLYAPDRVDDYCEEFRFHSHDEHADSALAPAPSVQPPDSAALSPRTGGGGG
jgi:hypothetical protein